jgi:hypothetical protein
VAERLAGAGEAVAVHAAVVVCAPEGTGASGGGGGGDPVATPNGVLLGTKDQVIPGSFNLPMLRSAISWNNPWVMSTLYGPGQSAHSSPTLATTDFP